MSKISDEINLIQFIYSTIISVITLSIFAIMYVLGLIPNSNFFFIIVWILISNFSFIVIVSIFKKGKLHLTRKDKITTYVLFNSILVLIASIVLITSDNINANLNVFFTFIAVQTFLGAIIK